MKPLALVAVTLASAAAGLLVGAALGLLSPYVYVALLGPILLGVAVGGAIAVAGLVSGTPLGRGLIAVAALGAAAGLCTTELLEDRQMRAAFVEDYARAAMVANGVPADAATDSDELAFYAVGAEEALERLVRRSAGQGGAVGRWLFRADAGVRLFGPLAEGRGLAVGRAGGVAFAVLEWLLATAVAALILRRVRARRRRSAPQPP
jgi:hypothetical protein